MIKRSGGEMLFPPMSRMIPSMGNFEIKNRTQAINDVTQVKYRKLAANRKNYIFYYLLSAVWTLRLKYLSNAVWSIFKQHSALNLGISNHLWRRGGLIVSAPDSGSGGPGSSPGRGHCVVFLGKTLYSHSASLHPGVQMGTSKCTGGNPAMD